MHNKSELRKVFREKRKEIKKDLSVEQRLCVNILESELYRKSEKVFLYAFSGDEADIDSVIHDALRQKKKVALPLCLDKKGLMEFRFIESISDLKCGMYEIREPDADRCEKADYDSNSLCFVPAICFDKKGYRLGYGKGYYDRFLEHFDGISVGVCFEGCVTEALPRGEHDKKVNYLITDDKIYVLSKEE